MRRLCLIATVSCIAGSWGLSPASAQTAPPSLVCDIIAHGAIAGDAINDDSAFAAAIAQCAGRGGQVHVPSGVFLTSGVSLKSDMIFHLAQGAVLRGLPTLNDYKVHATGDESRSRGVVTAIGARNLTISGSGTIDGAGTPFHTSLNARPDYSLGLFDCNAVVVTGITLIDPSKYHVTMNRCNQVRVDGVTILAAMLSPNSDGIQVRDSSDVTISNCRIETGDDAIVLKSSARMVERVHIRNCKLISDDAAFKFGTGSEPGIRDISVSDTIITNSRYGLALFMQDGGIYENVRFSNVSIATGGRHAREYPIFIDIDTRQPDSPADWGRIRNVTFDNLQIDTRGNILIQGQPDHDVEAIALSNITMRVANAVDLSKVNGKPRGNRAHAPRTGAADYSNSVGHIVIGHTNGVTLSGVTATGVTPADQRAVLITHDVKNLVTDNPNLAAGLQ